MNLHIGTHKTGTSSIQMALHTHREELLKAGVLYPPIEDNYNHRELAVLLQSPEGEQKLSVWFDDISSKVKQQPINKVIISAEALYFFKISELIKKEDGRNHSAITAETYRKKLLKLRSLISDNFDIKILIYIRRQDRFLESAFNQIVKGTFLFSGTIDDAFEGLSVYMDYYQVLNLWSEVFGKENIIVRVYEKQQLIGGSVKDFLQAIDLQPELIEKIITTTQNYNMRLSREILDYKLILNRLLEKEDPKRKDQLHYTFLETLSTHPEFNHKKKDLLKPEQTREILHRYAQGNSSVAREYLGRDDGRLFYESEQGKDYEDSYPGLSVDRAVEIGTQLSFLVIDSYEEREKINSSFSVFAYPNLLDAQGLLNSYPMKLLVRAYNRLKNEREIRIIRRSGLFDTEYYLQHNSDVAVSGMDPIRHYVYSGWKEARKPNASFDFHFYVMDHPEVIRLGLNPLVHFIKNCGKKEK